MRTLPITAARVQLGHGRNRAMRGEEIDVIVGGRKKGQQGWTALFSATWVDIWFIGFRVHCPVSKEIGGGIALVTALRQSHTGSFVPCSRRTTVLFSECHLHRAVGAKTIAMTRR